MDACTCKAYICKFCISFRPIFTYMESFITVINQGKLFECNKNYVDNLG